MTYFFKILPFCILGVLFFSQTSQAQKLDVSFDYAMFRYDSTKTYVELYYGFNNTSLHFIRSGQKDSLGIFSFADSILFDVSVARTDSVVSRQRWEVPVTLQDTTREFLTVSRVGKVDFAIPPGKYTLRAKGVDVSEPLNSDSLESDFLVPAYGNGKLESSEIELCSTISQGTGSGMFYKNTYNVVPNPSATYGMGMPIICYYLEIYNIPISASDDTLFTVGYEIRDSFGQVRKSSYKRRKKFGTSSVEVGTINGSNLKTGAYTFTYTVIDSAADLSATSSKRFFVYNPGLGKPEVPDTTIASGAVLSSVFATMGEAQLDGEFAEARYISTPMEEDQYEKLTTVDSKRQFLYEFWKKRNSDPALKSNETRPQYLQRVVYANDHFRAGARQGWQTDRGRVYIIYGQPDEIDRHPNETDSKPYEIWYFNSIEGGVSFDFVDRTGFGDYYLVNSTERSEVHDNNWQQYLTQ